MSILGKARQLVELATGDRIFVYKRAPRGIDLHHDIRTSLPHLNCRCIFDIGANIGKFTGQYAIYFENAQIHCFEPISSTYATLSKRYAHHPSIKCHQIAMSSSCGTQEIYLTDSSRESFLSTLGKTGRGVIIGAETVEVNTVDNFCMNENIDEIDFLKIDTEGADLDVLRGTARMLKMQRVNLIQAEVAINKDNNKHSQFREMAEYLNNYDYFVFGFYNQEPETPNEKPHLRYLDCVFVSRRIIDNNSSLTIR